MRESMIVDELRGIRSEIAQLREEMDRYRGFVGGVAWSLSCVAGVVGFVWGMLTGGW